MAHYPSVEWQESRALLGLALFSVRAAVAVVDSIAPYAGRLEPWHFNVPSPFHAATYSLMVAGAVMIAKGAVIAFAALRPVLTQLIFEDALAVRPLDAFLSR